jgi:hypothetical protein
MSKPENPAAFPCEELKRPDESDWILHRGMTLRDWFAGQALAGLCAQRDGTGDLSWLRKDAVTEAYSIADAMLQARREGR